MFYVILKTRGGFSLYAHFFVKVFKNKYYLAKKCIYARIKMKRVNEMKYYDELLNLECFTLQEVVDIIGNRNSAKSMVKRLQDKNLIERVKKNLYVTISPVDYEPTVSKFRIGSEINDCSIISHHAALEYYGYESQVYHKINVSSPCRFQTFEYRGSTYEHTTLKFDNGIDTTRNQIKVTSIERTMADCLHSVGLAGGIEEMIRCFRLIPRVKEDKLLEYLTLYDSNATYQRAGFILEMLNEDLALSVAFLSEIESRIKGNSRYLSAHQTQGCCYCKRWKLLVPKNLTTTINKGVENLGNQ